MKLDINENWNRWDEKQWLEAFPLLMESLPNLKVLSNSRKTFMETDKLPSPNQVQLIKKMYEEHALQETLEDNIKRTQIVMEENKHVFDVSLTSVVDWVNTFELAMRYCEDCIPNEELLLTYYFKKHQLGQNVGIPNRLREKFYAKYSDMLDTVKSTIVDDITNEHTPPEGEKDTPKLMTKFKLVFEED